MPSRVGTQRLQSSSLLVMTYFLLRDYNIQPKRELLWSLRVSNQDNESFHLGVGLTTVPKIMITYRGTVLFWEPQYRDPHWNGFKESPAIRNAPVRVSNWSPAFVLKFKAISMDRTCCALSMTLSEI